MDNVKLSYILSEFGLDSAIYCSDSDPLEALAVLADHGLIREEIINEVEYEEWLEACNLR